MFDVNWPVAESRLRVVVWLLSVHDVAIDAPSTDLATLNALYARVGGHTELKEIAHQLGGTWVGTWRVARGTVSDLFAVALAGPVEAGPVSLGDAVPPRGTLPLRRMIKMGTTFVGIYADGRQTLILHPQQGLRRSTFDGGAALLAQVLGQAADAPVASARIHLFDAALKVGAHLASRPEAKAPTLLRDAHVHLWDAVPGAPGGINEVVRVVYRVHVGRGDAVGGYFKADGPQPGAEPTLEKIGLYDGTHMAWLHTNFATRAVASVAVARALGLDVLSSDVLAEHRGTKGVVSAAVRGRPVVGKTYVERPDPAHSAALAAAPADPADPHNEKNPQRRHALDSLPPGARVVGDDVFLLLGEMALPVAWLDEVQAIRQIFDIQAVDFIVGQVDRHLGDLIWDADQRRLRGIDNDLAFGRDNARLLGDHTRWPGAFRGMPPFLDRRTAAAIQALNPKRQRLTHKTVSLPAVIEQASDKAWVPLTDDEVQAAADRLLALQTSLSNGEVEVVHEWSDKTEHELLATPPAQNLLRALVEEVRRSAAATAGS